MFSMLFSDTFQIQYQEENEDNWGGENTLAQLQTMPGIYLYIYIYVYIYGHGKLKPFGFYLNETKMIFPKV